MTNENDTGASIEATTAKAREEASKAGQKIGEEARAVADQAGELGREHAERRFEQGKATVEGQVDAMGAALGDAAERLREENNPLASYADELSGQLSKLSRGIESSTLDDLAVKTRQLARENPGLFVMGSMVAGLAAARFFKASAERERRERYGDGGHDHDDGYARAGGRIGGSGYRAESAYRSPIADAYRPRDDVRGGAGAIGSGAGGGGTNTRVPMDSDRTGSDSVGAGAGPGTTGGATGVAAGAGSATTDTGVTGGSAGAAHDVTTNRTGG